MKIPLELCFKKYRLVLIDSGTFYDSNSWLWCKWTMFKLGRRNVRAVLLSRKK